MATVPPPPQSPQSPPPGLLDVLLTDVPAEIILRACGSNAAASLAETSRGAAKASLSSRLSMRARPRDRGHARVFVLYNDRPSEKESDHYAQWRSGWEPVLEDRELRRWFPSEPLPRTYVRAQTRMCEIDSDDEAEEVTQPAVAQQAEEQGSELVHWDCSRCTLLNRRNQLTCTVCGLERPPLDVDFVDLDAVERPAASGVPDSSDELASAAVAAPVPQLGLRERKYSLAAFASWRGCNPQDFAGIHHGDLVLDEGQYRGKGAYVAQWSEGTAENDDDAGQLLLTPAVGLEGVMLPKEAWDVIEAHGPGYYERAGYGSWLFGELPVSAEEQAVHEQVVSEREQAAAAAAAAGEEAAKHRRLREIGAGADRATEDQYQETGAVLVPGGGTGATHVYCELRHASRLTRQMAPRPSDYRFHLQDSLKGDRSTAGAAGEPVWSKLSPQAFTEVELSSSSDLRSRQQQPLTSLLPPPPPAAASSIGGSVTVAAPSASAPALYDAGDTSNAGDDILSEDMAHSQFDPAPPPPVAAQEEPLGGVLTDNLAYMALSPSQRPLPASRARGARPSSPGYEGGGAPRVRGGYAGGPVLCASESFAHDGMARLYNNRECLCCLVPDCSPWH